MCERTTATRNEVLAPAQTSRIRRPARRLAGVLARRLGQRPTLLLGHDREGQTCSRSRDRLFLYRVLGIGMTGPGPLGSSVTVKLVVTSTAKRLSPISNT